MLGLLTAVPFAYRALALVALAIAIFGYGWVKGAAHGEARLNAYILTQTQQADAELQKRLQKESVLKVSQERLFNDLAKQKQARAADAIASAGRVRDFQSVLDRARSAAASATDGTAGAIATVASECARDIEKMDGYAKGIADKASGLQRYVVEVCLAK